MLNINNLTIKLKKDDRILVENFTFTINTGDKVAIIGEEGNGKSTLLKLIYDSSLILDYCDYTGQINKNGLNVSYLSQCLDACWNDVAVNHFLLKEKIETEINYDKYDLLINTSAFLSKIGINPEMVYSDQLMRTLSGGERIKVELAKIILAKPDIILLDEPTNDLDIETLIWLERFINSVTIPIVFISHDERLLENTANIIIHLEQLKRKRSPQYTIEKMGYKDYADRRLKSLSHQEMVARKQRQEHEEQLKRFKKIFEKVEYQQDIISRKDPHGAALLKKKMKSLKSQERRYEKEKETFLDIPDPEEAINLRFNNNISIPNGKKILSLENYSLKREEVLLSANINFNVVGPEHVVIIGRNGIGKTVFMEQIYLMLKDRTDIKVGYMPQNYGMLMDNNKTALAFILPGSTKAELSRAMTFMGSMRFTNEEMNSKISNLSEGQKAKLFLIKLILDNCNVLLLDEPTRNLSPLSNPIIRQSLTNYNGCIISVSHDRKYIDEVCSKVYELTENSLILKDSKI